MYTRDYEGLAMENFLVVCLINHVIGCMVQCINNNPVDSIIGIIIVGFAKYASCCGLVFIYKWHTRKSIHLENFYMT